MVDSSAIETTEKPSGLPAKIQEISKPNQVELKGDPVLIASAFLSNLRSVHIDRFPLTLRQKLQKSFCTWLGLEANEEVTLQQLIEESDKALDRAKTEDLLGEDSDDTMRLRFRVGKNPLSFPIEAEYAQEELETTFPQGLELQEAEGETLRFKMHAHMSGDFYIVERPNGKREILRIYDRHRSIDDIKTDLFLVPSVLPTMRAHQFKDSSVGILQDWVNGHHPKTEEEKSLCRDASDSLVTVPWEIEEPLTPYDLNVTNFIIAESVTNQPKVYYVDNDLIGVIVRHGLSDKTPQVRKELLNRGKEKLK